MALEPHADPPALPAPHRLILNAHNKRRPHRPPFAFHQVIVLLVCPQLVLLLVIASDRRARGNLDATLRLIVARFIAKTR